MKKIIVLVLMATLTLMVLSGCSKQAAPAEAPATEPATEAADVDAVATASVVTDADALAKGLAKDGIWLIATLNDIESSEPIVVEGEFTNRDVVDRKLALYTQDENRKITAQFKLTAPKLIVKSPNFRLQGGTFVGDVYVEAPGFKLDGSSTVDGNIFFADQKLMDTFIVTDTSKLTGKIVVGGADVVTTASLVADTDSLIKGLSKDGTWIVSVVNNMIVKSDIVVEGEFINRDAIARKLSLYSQDADRNITARYELTAPQLIVKSENFRIQGGTFKGDVYVEAAGFALVNGTVDGNVFFASKELMDSSTIDADSKVTGAVEVKN